MKKIIITFFIISFNSSLFCQSKVDSLKQELKKLSLQKGYTADTANIYIMLMLGNAFQKIQLDSSISYAVKANDLARKIRDQLKEAEVQNIIGYYNFLKSDYRIALNCYSKSLSLLKKLSLNKDKKLKAIIIEGNVLNSIGIVNIMLSRFPEALDSFFNALKINESGGIDTKNELAKSLNGIGLVYLQQKAYNKALEYFYKSDKLNTELGNKLGKANVMLNISNTYLSLNNLDKSLTILLEALELAEQNNNPQLQKKIFNNLANVYTTKGNYIKALDYYFQAFNLAKKTNNKSDLLNPLGNISGIYFNQKKYKLCEEYIKQTYNIASEIGSLTHIADCLIQLSLLYQKTNRPALALESYKKYIIYRDSITNVENDKAIIQKELQYNYDKKATADSIVNAKAQEIKDAQLAKNKLEIKAKQNQQYALFGGLALVLVFAGFMYNRFKITQRQKVIIEEQKKLVDVSQKKTMDSINYAKKIQHSILPSSEQLGAIFPNYFIFFKPKDIVSGDFYWFHHQDNLSFIAVADCTGHGVPGAFMTMIGYSNLIEVVAQQKVIEPNKILENLHQHIFNNLQQNKGDTYSQDGMDISLVVIDHENSLLHFSAAYNHGYLVHNKQIHTLKATSKSIGGLSILGEIEPERKFKAETIHFTKGSLLILTTDGIFDQLNKQDEKFGNERFKELALNFNAENAQENLKVLKQTYNNWKEGAQQLDDLCLVGIVI